MPFLIEAMTFQERAIDFGFTYGTQMIGAVIILAVGLLIAKILGRWTMRYLTKHELEPPVRMLIVRVVWLIVLAFTIVAVLDKFGVQVLPLVAGLGVIGVGVGLAMQGVLSNLVAGLTIIFTKPFLVGEYIDILGHEGEVNMIDMFSTVLIHSDKSRVVIPNRKIVGEVLHNYGRIRQLNLTVHVAQDAQLDVVLGAIQTVLRGNARVLKDPTPVVGVSTIAGPVIQVSVAPWVATTDFGPAQAELNRALVEQFRTSKIAVPEPNHNVRLVGGDAAVKALA